MGLLDDAIRDHLDLKRRRGADPAEVERAEREALGPVRRRPEPADDELGYVDEPIAPADPVGIESEDALYGEEPLPYEDEVQDGTDWRGVVPHAEVHDPPSAPPPHDARWTNDDEAVDDRQPGVDTKPHETVRADHGSSPPRPVPRISEETAEYDVEGEEHAGGDREDVLEETPEFLQDTPDHDRLWFEQRPPRDFNFDG